MQITNQDFLQSLLNDFYVEDCPNNSKVIDDNIIKQKQKIKDAKLSLKKYELRLRAVHEIIKELEEKENSNDSDDDLILITGLLYLLHGYVRELRDKMHNINIENELHKKGCLVSQKTTTHYRAKVSSLLLKKLKKV